MSHPEAVSVTVSAQPGTRLEDLLARYESTKAAAEEAASRFESLTRAIKAEMSSAAGGQATSITLTGDASQPVLRMRWVPRWDFRVKDFKRDYPVLYVQYGSQGGRWELRGEQ